MGDAFTSSMTYFSRFSNSPFTPAPACSRPRSSVRSATFLSGGGTSPGGDAQREALDDRRLADARLAGEDRVVLPAAGEDVDDLADLGVAAEDRVDLARLGPLGQVDGELVERRRLARRPGRAGRGLAGTPALRGRGAFVLARAGDDLQQVFPERLGRDLRQLRRGVPRLAPERLVRQEGQEDHARADLPGLVLDRGEHPGLADQVVDLDRERRRARVAGLEPVERGDEVALDARRDRSRSARKSRFRSVFGRLGELEQPVLDLDVGLVRDRQSPAAACSASRQVLFNFLISDPESRPMMRSSPRRKGIDRLRSNQTPGAKTASSTSAPGTRAPEPGITAQACPLPRGRGQLAIGDLVGLQDELHVEVELGVDEQARHLGQRAERCAAGQELAELGERQRPDAEPELALLVPDAPAQDHADPQFDCARRMCPRSSGRPARAGAIARRTAGPPPAARTRRARRPRGPRRGGVCRAKWPA